MNSRFSCHICSVGEMGDNQCRNCATSTEGLQPGKPEEEGDFLTKGIQGKAGKGRGRQECGKVDLAVLQLKSPDIMSCEEMKHCLRGEGQGSVRKEGSVDEQAYKAPGWGDYSRRKVEIQESDVESATSS